MPVSTLPGRLVFNEAEFRAIVDRRGLGNDGYAAALGVHRITYSRLASGAIEPGEAIFRAFMARFPDIDPRQVFSYDPDAQR